MNLNQKKHQWILVILLVALNIFIFGNALSYAATEIDKTRFERVDPSNAWGTSRIMIRPIKKTAMTAFIGDYLSRIWALYGPPDSVEFEGFIYTFQDKETGLIFTAYSAGSGPAYGGDPKKAAQLKPVILLFEELLQQTKPADCEIEYDTDYGKYRSGAKDGVPFDEQIEE